MLFFFFAPVATKQKVNLTWQKNQMLCDSSSCFDLVSEESSSSSKEEPVA